jgi:hypothetical protein
LPNLVDELEVGWNAGALEMELDHVRRFSLED